MLRAQKAGDERRQEKDPESRLRWQVAGKGYRPLRESYLHDLMDGVAIWSERDDYCLAVEDFEAFGAPTDVIHNSHSCMCCLQSISNHQ